MTNLNPNSDRIKTRHLQNLITRKHSDFGWCLMFELANNITNMKSRADALAVDLYRNEIHGYEIKASRGDWLNELKNPEKSNHIAKYCDFWWIAAPKDLIQLSELPTDWGLIESTKYQLRVKVKAPLRDKTPLTLQLVSSMLRNLENHHNYPREKIAAFELSEDFKPLDLTKKYKTRAGQDVFDLTLMPNFLGKSNKITGYINQISQSERIWFENGKYDIIGGNHYLDLFEVKK